MSKDKDDELIQTLIMILIIVLFFAFIYTGIYGVQERLKYKQEIELITMERDLYKSLVEVVENE